MTITDNSLYENKVFKHRGLSKLVFSEVECEECTFESCDLSSSKFYKCRFRKCTFDGCNLSLWALPETRLSECRFKNCKMTGIDWSLTSSDMGLEMHCTECDLSYSSFMKIDISSSVFTDCVITEADFSETKMTKCTFSGTDLQRSTFYRTDACECDFRGAVNYAIDPKENKLKKSKFSYPSVLGLLSGYGITVE